MTAVTMVVAIAKLVFAWHLFRQAWQQGHAQLPPAAAAKVKRQVLTEVAKGKAVQA